MDARTNSLLITALPEDMPRIKELIAQLDVDIVERERSYHIYALENVGAEDLADTLNEFLEDAVQPRRAGAGANNRGGQAPRSSTNNREFVVVADPETNSLLIAANRTQYQELQALIERLDRRQDQVLIETALIETSGSDFLDIGVELGSRTSPERPRTAASASRASASRPSWTPTATASSTCARRTSARASRPASSTATTSRSRPCWR